MRSRIGHSARVEGWERRAGRDVFDALERATPVIVNALRPYGVIGAEYAVGFVHPFRVHVWLVTATDAERDVLGSSNPFLSTVTSAIRSTDFPVERATIDGTVVQSQETVDRDFDGSWFYALR